MSDIKIKTTTNDIIITKEYKKINKDNNTGQCIEKESTEEGKITVIVNICHLEQVMKALEF